MIPGFRVERETNSLLFKPKLEIEWTHSTDHLRLKMFWPTNNTWGKQQGRRSLLPHTERLTLSSQVGTLAPINIPSWALKLATGSLLSGAKAQALSPHFDTCWRVMSKGKNISVWLREGAGGFSMSMVGLRHCLTSQGSRIPQLCSTCETLQVGRCKSSPHNAFSSTFSPKSYKIFISSICIHKFL